jgi:hypothetical protein
VLQISITMTNSVQYTPRALIWQSLDSRPHPSFGEGARAYQTHERRPMTVRARISNEARGEGHHKFVNAQRIIAIVGYSPGTSTCGCASLRREYEPSILTYCCIIQSETQYPTCTARAARLEHTAVHFAQMAKPVFCFSHAFECFFMLRSQPKSHLRQTGQAK